MKILLAILCSLISITIYAQKKSIKKSNPIKQQKTHVNLIDSFTAVLYPSFGKEFNDDASALNVLAEDCKLKFSFSKINDLEDGYCVFSFEDDGDLQTQEIKLNDNIPYSKKCNGKDYLIIAKYIKYFKNQNTPIGSKVMMDFKIYEEKNQSTKKNNIEVKKIKAARAIEGNKKLRPRTSPNVNLPVVPTT